MIKLLKVFCVIPARGGSERLPKKNIYPVWGKPMIYWAIKACKNSLYIDDVFVSTESNKILAAASQFGAKIINRPNDLANGKVFKQDVIIDAVNQLSSKYMCVPDIVISLQPNSPQIRSIDLDNAIEKLVKYDRNEIFSVNKDLIQNAAFRIMKRDYVFQKSISTRSGVFVTDYIDVHTLEDVELLEKTSRHE